MSLTFAKLSTTEGLGQLNAYFLGRTYTFGIGPSSADAELVKLVGAAPAAATYPHAARWFAHITSFAAAKQAKFDAATLAVGEVKPVAAAAAAGGDDSDSDDDDLFGDDSDDDSDDDLSALAAAAENKVDPNKWMWERSQLVIDIKPLDDETDLEALGTAVLETDFADFERGVEAMKREQAAVAGIDDIINYEAALQWGENFELQDVAYGIQKLVVSVVMMDDIFGTDDIVDYLMNMFEDKIQSIDVRGFNKASQIKLPKSHPNRARYQKMKASGELGADVVLGEAE